MEEKGLKAYHISLFGTEMEEIRKNDVSEWLSNKALKTTIHKRRGFGRRNTQNAGRENGSW